MEHVDAFFKSLSSFSSRWAILRPILHQNKKPVAKETPASKLDLVLRKRFIRDVTLALESRYRTISMFSMQRAISDEQEVDKAIKKIVSEEREIITFYAEDTCTLDELEKMMQTKIEQGEQLPPSQEEYLLLMARLVISQFEETLNQENYAQLFEAHLLALNSDLENPEVTNEQIHRFINWFGVRFAHFLDPAPEDDIPF